MRHCNKGEYEGSCKYGDYDCPALKPKTGEPKMTIVEFFDPYNVEHLKAYRHLEKTGFWPVSFYPENVEWPLIWQAALTAKMTQAWLEAVENGKVAVIAQPKPIKTPKAAYTVDQLDKALMVIFKNNSAYIKAAGRPSACARAAEMCFAYQLPESAETEIIKSAVLDLHTDGFFTYSKE